MAKKLHLLRSLNEAVDHSKLVNEVINTTMMMSVQARFWHWQTKSYAAHTALGEFYDKLTEMNDALAEQFMGAGGAIEPDTTYELIPFEKKKVVEKITDYKQLLTSVETPLMGDKNQPMHGVADTIIDAVKMCDKLLYLLTLE